MRRVLLVLVLAACESGDDTAPTCEELQRSKQEIGECIVDSDPAYSEGCPFVLGGLCYPNGFESDCDPLFADMGGIGCDLGGTNCTYGLPHCEPIDETRVKYGVRLVRDGIRGMIRFDLEADTCEFVPCQ